MATPKNRTFSVTVAANAPCYAEVQVAAKSQEAAEQKVLKDLHKNGWESPYWTDCRMCPEYTEATDLRVVTSNTSVIVRKD